MIRRRRALALPVAVLAVATFGLSGCSDAGETPAAPSVATPEYSGDHATGDHNQADVDFATMMFANRLQVVQLIGLAQSKSQNEDVKGAATDLSDDQAGEIADLGGWLDGWGVQAANIKPADHAGMAGVLAAKDVTALEGLNGAAFDKAWVGKIIESLKGSLTAAQDEQKKGKNGEALSFANDVVERQGGTISDLTELLGQLP
ncbi:MAG: DUF305 domain-containing protein [Kineosporiaceae bacterium]